MPKQTFPELPTMIEFDSIVYQRKTTSLMMDLTVWMTSLCVENVHTNSQMSTYPNLVHWYCQATMIAQTKNIHLGL